MVSYVKQSTADVYGRYNLSINRVISTRFVKWENNILGEMKTKSKQQDGYYTVSEDKEESTQTTASDKQADERSVRAKA